MRITREKPSQENMNGGSTNERNSEYRCTALRMEKDRIRLWRGRLSALLDAGKLLSDRLLYRRRRSGPAGHLRDHADRPHLGRGQRPDVRLHRRKHPIQVGPLPSLHPLRHALPGALQLPDLPESGHFTCGESDLVWRHLHLLRHGLHGRQHLRRLPGQLSDLPQHRARFPQRLPRLYRLRYGHPHEHDHHAAAPVLRQGLHLLRARLLHGRYDLLSDQHPLLPYLLLQHQGSRRRRRQEERKRRKGAVGIL